MPSLSSASARRSRARRVRQAALVDAAEAVFAERGLDAASMDAVAAQADVSKGLAYTYFADKGDLCDAVAARALRRLRAALAEAVHRPSPDAFGRLAALAGAYAAFARDRPADFALLEYRVGQAPPYAAGSHAAACHRITLGLFSMARRALRTGLADGSVRPGLDPDRAALALWSGLHGFVATALRSDVEAWYGVERAVLLGDGLRLLLDGVRPCPPSR